VNQLAAYSFEDHKLDQLHLDGAGIAITNAVSAGGTQSLEMKECDGNDRQWMPLVSIPIPAKEHAAAAGYQISFDAMLDDDLPGVLSLNIRGPTSSVKQKQKQKTETGESRHSRHCEGWNTSEHTAPRTKCTRQLESF